LASGERELEVAVREVLELHPDRARTPQTIVRPPGWGRPATASVSTAETSLDAPAFVFHDIGGRRWPRIKRTTLVVGAVLVAVAGAVLLAVANVAPGRAPFSRGSAGIPQQVSDWPVRSPNDAPASTSGTGPPAQVGPAQAQARPGAMSIPSPASSARPSPAPFARPSPKKTKPPVRPPH
jgi:hypothetical protein